MHGTFRLPVNRNNIMSSSTAVINDIPLSSPTFFNVPEKAEKVDLFF
jgi:hypothetical protein